MRRLYRIPQKGKLAGVCEGLGEYFEIDPVIFRLLFVLGTFFGGGLLAYIIAWIVVPEKI